MLCTYNYAEQNDKGTWDQKHWEDLMLKVEYCYKMCGNNI